MERRRCTEPYVRTGVANGESNPHTPRGFGEEHL